MAGVFVPRGLPLAVLRAISILGQDNAYGLAIFRHFKSTGDPVPLQRVYVALDRLARRGLIESKSVPSIKRGHPRRCWKLTDQGERSLTAALRMLGVETKEKVAADGP